MLKKLNGTATAGNANKDFVVGADDVQRILYGQVVLTTDATAANRRVIFRILDDSSNTVTDIHSGATVPASQSLQHHEFMQGIFRETAFVGTALQVPIPIDCCLLPSWTLRIFIENGVAGDSFTCNFVVDEFHNGATLYH